MRLRKLYHPVITSIIWRKSNSALMRASKAHPQSITISRYEDLINDPEGSLGHLCDFIGERFELQMVETDFSNSSNEGLETGIFKTGVGRWSGQLSDVDVFLAQVICRKLMLHYHYRPAPAHPHSLSLTGTVLSTPIKLIRALHANRAIRGPLLPYLWKRIRPL